MKEDY